MESGSPLVVSVHGAIYPGTATRAVSAVLAKTAASRRKR